MLSDYNYNAVVDVVRAVSPTRDGVRGPHAISGTFSITLIGVIDNLVTVGAYTVFRYFLLISMVYKTVNFRLLKL